MEESAAIKVEEVTISDVLNSDSEPTVTNGGCDYQSTIPIIGANAVKREPATDTSDKTEPASAAFRSRHAQMVDEEQFEDECPDDIGGDPSFEMNFSAQKRTKKRRAKVCSGWSDKDIFKLILCVERMPMLWNVKDERYRNKLQRRSAWMQISAINFDRKFPDHELMAKWANMRVQYRSYYIKYQKLKPGVHSTVKWKFYDAMNFIIRSEEEQTAVPASNLTNTDERSIESPFERSPISTPLASKRRRLSQSSSVTATSSPYNTAEALKDAVSQLKEQQQTHEDEIDAFGKYVAAELRSLSDSKSAQRVRFRVARYLMDCIEAENRFASEVYGPDEKLILLAHLQEQQKRQHRERCE